MRSATIAFYLCGILLLFGTPVAAQTVFINELHYDNDGADADEAVEIAGPAGTDLSGYSIVFYNGNGGGVYKTENLSGHLPDQQNGYGTLNFPVSGIQNDTDGLALMGPSGVIQFLSYEGSFVADGGAADGMTSTDIGVDEQPVPNAGLSLQLTGTGTAYSDFTWSGPTTSTPGAVNTGQAFPPTVTIATEKITPTLDSLVANCDGTYTAFFGYDNPNLLAVEIPVGPNNNFSPAPLDRGQPTEFSPGAQRQAFSVSFSGPGSLTWFLRSPNGEHGSAMAMPANALPASGCLCQDPSTAPSYAGGYVLNSTQSRAAVRTETPTGGLVFEFYNTNNLNIEDPEVADGSNPSGFTRVGDTFTFAAATPSPTTLFFPITRADPSVARVSFYLRITDTCGRIVDVDPSFAVTDILDEAAPALTLSRAAPSPTAGPTMIAYSLAEASHATLAVYDMLGREVARLVDGVMPEGLHEARFDPAGLPSGVYLYRLTAGAKTLQSSFTVTR